MLCLLVGCRDQNRVCKDSNDVDEADDVVTCIRVHGRSGRRRSLSLCEKLTRVLYSLGKQGRLSVVEFGELGGFAKLGDLGQNLIWAGGCCTAYAIQAATRLAMFTFKVRRFQHQIQRSREVL